MIEMETKVFRMTRIAFLKEIVKLHGLPWLIGMVIVMISAVVLSIFHDIRWAVISLMILLILFPMLMAIFYLYYGLQQVTVINVIPHSLAFREDFIEATLYSLENEEGSEDKIYSVISVLKYPFSGFGIIRTGLSSIVLPLKDRKKGFIWLPIDAFESRDSFSEAAGMIISHIRRNKS